MQRVHKEHGFSLVEIIVACAIVSLTLVSVISLYGQALTFSDQSLHVYQASTLLEEGAEITRVLRDNGWSNISTLATSTSYYPVFATSTNTWSLTTTSTSIDIFTRSISVSPVYRDGSARIASSGTLDTNSKLITVTVSWNETTGLVTKTFSFYLMNIFAT